MSLKYFLKRDRFILLKLTYKLGDFTRIIPFEIAPCNQVFGLDLSSITAFSQFRGKAIKIYSFEVDLNGQIAIEWLNVRIRESWFGKIS